MKLTDYRKISKQVADDVAAALAKHGLKMKPFGARIDERLGVVRMTIECSDVNHKDADGLETTPERELYKSHALLFGLDPAWLDSKITFGRTEYAVAGLNKTRGAKNVLVRRCADNKMLVTTAEQVRRAFAEQQLRRVS